MDNLIEIFDRLVTDDLTLIKAENCADEAKRVAIDFLVWYKEAKDDSWAKYATNEEMFEQFCFTL